MQSNRVTTMDRSMVAVVDIESFTTRALPDQGRLIEEFVDGLNRSLAQLEDLSPSAWSTGDGAIISIGRNCTVDESSAARFMDFVIGFMAELLDSGVVVRTVVNYASLDRIIELDPTKPFKGDFVQIGHTINDAARLMTFCEPRELLVSSSIVDLLADLGLDGRYPFKRNDPFKTKHSQALLTYSFDADPQAHPNFYSPRSYLHKYKRYSSFPPIKSKVLEYFDGNGLDYEIGRVIRSAYDAMETISATRTFLSWSPALRVLQQLAYDPSDRVLIVSRNDHPGFWTQARRSEYLDDLGKIAHQYGYINQTRIMVPDAHALEVMTEEDRLLHDRLLAMHAPDTFWSFPANRLFRYDTIEPLLYGFTLSVRHGYAIIPVPAPDEVDLGPLTPDSIAHLIARYPNYNASDGPMKAVITANRDFVDAMISDCDAILASMEGLKLK